MKKYLYTILITFLVIVLTINSKLLGPLVLISGVAVMGFFGVVDLANWVENREISETEKYLEKKDKLDLEMEALQSRYEKLTEQIENATKKKKKGA